MRPDPLSRIGPRPSGAAIAICVLLVAGSVLFGVFGPGIAQRSQLSGISLGELVGAAAMVRDQLLAAALADRPTTLRTDPDGPADAAAAKTAASSLLRELFGRSVEVPDLSARGLKLAVVRTAALGSDRPNAVALGYIDRVRRSLLAVFVLPDSGLFVIFDDFGRPVPLEPHHTLVEPIERSRRDETRAIVRSDGPLLWIGIADSLEDAEALRAALEASTTP